MECLETAAKKIAKKPSESTSLNKAKVAQEKGPASRQKLIKIADRSKSTHKAASSSVTTARLVFSAY